MLRNKRPKLIENEVVNAKKVLRLGALSEQKWVWAWVLKFNVFQRPSWRRQNSIWTAVLGSKWAPKTVLHSVFFRVPTSRHDYWKKCTPPRRKPCFCMLTRSENGSIWGSKIDQKSLLFRHPSWKRFLLIFSAKMKVLGVQDGGQISAKIDLKTIRLRCQNMYRSSCLAPEPTCRSGGLARGAGGPT